MIPRLVLLATMAAALAGCTGVLDRCTQGFDSPPGRLDGSSLTPIRVANRTVAIR